MVTGGYTDGDRRAATDLAQAASKALLEGRDWVNITVPARARSRASSSQVVVFRRPRLMGELLCENDQGRMVVQVNATSLLAWLAAQGLVEVVARTPTGDEWLTRPAGCQCHLEAGDSPCRVHGEETQRGRSTRGGPEVHRPRARSDRTSRRGPGAARCPGEEREVNDTTTPPVTEPRIVYCLNHDGEMEPCVVVRADRRPGRSVVARVNPTSMYPIITVRNDWLFHRPKGE